jgi:hypothetical protein
VFSAKLSTFSLQERLITFDLSMPVPLPAAMISIQAVGRANWTWLMIAGARRSFLTQRVKRGSDVIGLGLDLDMRQSDRILAWENSPTRLRRFATALLPG